jgi:Spy/CpxP family protein refolding chaperone
MIRIHWGVLALAVVVAVAAISYSDDTTTPPASEKPKAVKVNSPWSKIKSLSDDQKQKIHEIHAKALADIKEIRTKETADITALLTDDQKTELAKIQADSAKPKTPKPDDDDQEQQ